MDVKGNAGKRSIPSSVRARLEQIIRAELYPPAAYPRRWFPELDSIVHGLFREEWHARESLRQQFLAADAQQAAALAERLLGLPALLASHPHAVVMIYRNLIAGYVQRRHYHHEEREDILQEMLSRILADKILRIQKKYDAHFSQMPSFTSYFMVCVRNIYMDIVREGKFAMLQREGEPREVPEKTDFMNAKGILGKAVLEEEFFRVRSIFRLQPAIYGKLVLCLKLKFRLPVAAEDATRCFPDCSATDVELLSRDYRCWKDRDLFQAVVAIFNRHESRPIQADTLRKWIENKTATVIELLNQMHQAPVYDVGNIADLLNLFFEAQDDHEHQEE
jgi:DNA-directed RNA polymerase specialized sigma24 family protein